MGGVDESQEVEAVDEEGVELEEEVESEEVIEEAVREHLTSRFQVPVINRNPLAVKYTRPDSKILQVGKRGATIGFQVATNAMRNRILATIAVMAVVAGPVWFAAGKYHGQRISTLEEKVTELEEEVNELKEENEELEEERLEWLLDQARSGD